MNDRPNERDRAGAGVMGQLPVRSALRPAAPSGGTRGRPHRCASLPAVLVMLAAAPTWAQGDPGAAEDIVAGRCAVCHQVPGHPEPTRRLGADAPSFRAIADDAAFYTRQRLRMILFEPHYPMTTFILTTTGVNDVIAYIERLRAP